LLKLYLNEITDRYIQENFVRLLEFARVQAVLNGEFKFIELSVPAAATNRRIRHGLGFRPKDVIFLSATNGVIPVWNYDSFDKEFIDFTTSGATDIRAFIGTYREPVQ